jgi:CYTH domain-containing protein
MVAKRHPHQTLETLGTLVHPVTIAPKLEIERKYVLDETILSRLLLLEPYVEPIRIWQGYLLDDGDSELRVRLYRYQGAEPSSYVNINGVNYSGAVVTHKKGSGLVREEQEEVTTIAAGVLLYQNSPHKLLKSRFVIEDWAIDVYHGRHEGLVVAERELATQDEQLVFPALFHGVGSVEVTGNKAYSNLRLAKADTQSLGLLLDRR